MKEQICEQCGEVILSPYMVTDTIWREHGVGERHLCLNCLEDRAERKLFGNDFILCYLNVVDSKEIRVRMGLSTDYAFGFKDGFKDCLE